jgi:hypothetical protein
METSRAVAEQQQRCARRPGFWRTEEEEDEGGGGGQLVFLESDNLTAYGEEVAMSAKSCMKSCRHT